MVQKITREALAAQAEIHVEAPRYLRNAPLDRGFELPSRLYVALGALFFGFLAVMAKGFASPGLIVPMAICVVFLTAFLAVPVIFTRTGPADKVPAMGWERFLREGIDTPFGRVSARDATVQVLILPVLIFAWGVCVVTIAALV